MREQRRLSGIGAVSIGAIVIGAPGLTSTQPVACSDHGPVMAPLTRLCRAAATTTPQADHILGSATGSSAAGGTGGAGSGLSLGGQATSGSQPSAAPPPAHRSVTRSGGRGQAQGDGGGLIGPLAGPASFTAGLPWDYRGYRSLLTTSPLKLPSVPPGRVAVRPAADNSPASGDEPWLIGGSAVSYVVGMTLLGVARIRQCASAIDAMHQ